MKFKQYYSCSLFGHSQLLNTEKIKARLLAELERSINNNTRQFFVGTHGEFDKLALECLRILRRKYCYIKITVVFTSLNSLNKDNTGLSRVDSYKDVETLYYPIEEIYFRRKIIVSNQYMVDDSNLIICYINNQKVASGAKRALDYAKKKGKEIFNIFDSQDLQI